MKKLTTIISILMMSLPLAFSKEKKAGSITVMSYNIRYGRADDGTNSWAFRAPATLEMISDQAPDVIGVQEMLDEQLRVLLYNLTDYKAVGIGRNDGKKDGEMMSLMYNKKTTSLLKWGAFWLSETPEVPSKGWDAACLRTATWALLKDKKSGEKYYFVDTHLDHKGKVARLEQGKLLLSKMSEINKDNLRMVIVGDFNMSPDHAALKPFYENMKNARDVATSTDDHYTFNGWGKAKEMIDYIWFSGFRSCPEFKTITKPYHDRTFISDHYPVRAELFF